jgi:hypothetical protein
MCRFSGELGMMNALYTNGFMIGRRPLLAERLMSPDNALVFVRVSINAVSPKAVTASWGIRNPEEIAFQLCALESLLRAREHALATLRGVRSGIPSIQVSTIVDSRNVDDLLLVCRTVANIFRTCRTTIGPEDVMVVRPIVVDRPDGYSAYDHRDEVIQQILRTCGHGGDGWNLLNEAQVPLFLGFGLDLVDSGAMPGYPEVIRAEYDQRDVCWANGLFLTVGPDASVYPCMELNCDQRWILGNLKSETVEEVYQGEPRIRFLEMAEQMRWGPKLFHPFSRTTRLDRIAKAVINGELTDELIALIRKKSHESPPLLLN